jgi:hypothetical protein
MRLVPREHYRGSTVDQAQQPHDGRPLHCPSQRRLYPHCTTRWFREAYAGVRMRKAHCVGCGEPYDIRRKINLGINFCLDCGDFQAKEQRASWCIVPLPKQGYTRVTNKTDLLHLNQKTR